MTDKPKHKPKPEQTLMDAIGFTEEDLKANREGRLTPFQKQSMRRQQTLWSIAFVGALAVFGVPLLGLAIAGFAALNLRNWEMLALVAVAALIVIGLLVFVASKISKFDKDLAGNPDVCEGRIQLDIQGDTRNTNLNITIEQERFRVDKRVFLAFKNADPYRIYYAPHSKTILSAEWLRDD